jgi:hypothetical protein
MLRAVSNIIYDLPPATWDQILSLNTTSIPIGATIRATDLSMHQFVWDGSNWQSSNGALIKVGSSRTQTTVLGSTSTSNQIVYTSVLPASLLGNKGALLLKAKAAGAASTNVKGYGIVDLGTTSELGYARSVSTATPFIDADIRAVLSSNSSIMSGLKSNVTSYGYSGSLNSYTVDFTVSRTINIVSLVQSASESLIMYGYDLYAERII